MRDAQVSRVGEEVAASGRRGTCKAEVLKRKPWVVFAGKFKYAVTGCEVREVAHLALSKGKYPYSYVDSLDRLH
jgi:hypothetical protein